LPHDYINISGMIFGAIPRFDEVMDSVITQGSSHHGICPKNVVNFGQDGYHAQSFPGS
jgi:hypothetical protein